MSVFIRELFLNVQMIIKGCQPNSTNVLVIVLEINQDEVACIFCFAITHQFEISFFVFVINTIILQRLIIGKYIYKQTLPI